MIWLCCKAAGPLARRVSPVHGAILSTRPMPKTLRASRARTAPDGCGCRHRTVRRGASRSSTPRRCAGPGQSGRRGQPPATASPRLSGGGKTLRQARPPAAAVTFGNDRSSAFRNLHGAAESRLPPCASAPSINGPRGVPPGQIALPRAPCHAGSGPVSVQSSPRGHLTDRLGRRDPPCYCPAVLGRCLGVGSTPTRAAASRSRVRPSHLPSTSGPARTSGAS